MVGLLTAGAVIWVMYKMLKPGGMTGGCLTSLFKLMIWTAIVGVIGVVCLMLLIYSALSHP